jgi:hypothetical protein
MVVVFSCMCIRLKTGRFLEPNQSFIVWKILPDLTGSHPLPESRYKQNHTYKRQLTIESNPTCTNNQYHNAGRARILANHSLRLSWMHAGRLRTVDAQTSDVPRMLHSPALCKRQFNPFGFLSFGRPHRYICTARRFL